MAYDFFSVIASWQEIGVYGVLLPFLLIFTLTFAILQKTKILGDKHKNLNIIVSFVLGLLFLQNVYLVESIQIFLPKIAYALLFFLMFLLLIGVFTGSADTFKKWTWVAVVLAVLALLWASSSDYTGGFLDWWRDSPELSQFIWIGLIVGGLIWLVQQDSGSEKGKDKGHE